MLTITRALARRLRVVFTRAVGRSRLGLSHVLFRSGPDGLTIGVRGLNAAVEYRQTGETSGSFAAPLELLKKCEGTSDTPVVLEPQAESVTVRWTDAGVPQAESFPRHEPFELPLRADRMESNDHRLLTALREAAECTDSVAARYALSCVQLSGGDGRIAATDAHQLLVERGFTFPWSDDVLVPASDVFASRELHTVDPVLVGRSDDFVTLSTGPWTIHLRIEKESRFPRIDSIVPDAASAESVLHLGEDDCQFLLSALPRLPGQKEPDSPVTCDLNGQVMIRSKGEDQPHATEVLLTNSRLDGKPVLSQTNRRYLARALQLDFRTVRLFDGQTTVLCQDEQRTYLWMLLGAAGAIPAGENVTRLESPATGMATDQSGGTPSPKPIRRNRNVQNTTPESVCRVEPGSGNGQQASNGESGSAPSAVESLIALRETLRTAVTQTNDAIRALKRQRREDRLVRSTLASLRQLQNIDA